MSDYDEDIPPSPNDNNVEFPVDEDPRRDRPKNGCLGIIFLGIFVIIILIFAG
jgi:hypothetical protein